MIPVTKPFLPPIEEYEKYIKDIWERNWLTNMGPLSIKLEEELKKYLDVNNLLFVTNGTIALQIAIKALDLKGEIITTPFSFVATTSSIVWEGCKPVFVDIDKDSLCIDTTKIEKAINKNTTAILATHVYGNPCDVFKIDEIAKKYDLKVIYDGAHAFGVKINGKSIFEYGDISICSLHATKLYHSVEGGMIITTNSDLLEKLSKIRNFGIFTETTFSELGINGKNSEFHAAMGLVNLKYINDIIARRRKLIEKYNLKLQNMRPKWHYLSKNNGAYYPVIFNSECLLLKVIEVLSANSIKTRRYFYPSLALALPYVKNATCPITEDISKRVLCLPLYYDLTEDEIDMICEIINKVQHSQNW